MIEKKLKITEISARFCFSAGLVHGEIACIFKAIARFAGRERGCAGNHPTCHISALPLKAGAVSQNSSRFDKSWPMVIGASGCFHPGGGLHRLRLVAPTPGWKTTCTDTHL